MGSDDSGVCLFLLAVLYPMTEREVQKACVKALEQMGWFVTQFSIPRRAYKQVVGVPDIYAVHTGHRAQLWLECKRPGGKTRPSQSAWMTRVAASGAICIVVDSDLKLYDHLRKEEFIA